MQQKFYVFILSWKGWGGKWQLLSWVQYKDSLICLPWHLHTSWLFLINWSENTSRQFFCLWRDSVGTILTSGRQNILSYLYVPWRGTKGRTWGVKSGCDNWNFLTSYLGPIMLYVASITFQEYLLLFTSKDSL